MVTMKVELHGMDGLGGPLYLGTCCFHRRDVLCGRKFIKGCNFQWKIDVDNKRKKSIQELEEETKLLASCTYEQNTEWGNEVVSKLSIFNFSFELRKNELHFIITRCLIADGT